MTSLTNFPVSSRSRFARPYPGPSIYNPRYLFISHHEAEFIRFLATAFLDGLKSLHSMVNSKLSYPNWDNFPFRIRVYSKPGLIIIESMRSWFNSFLFSKKALSGIRSYTFRKMIVYLPPWSKILRLVLRVTTIWGKGTIIVRIKYGYE